MRKRTTKKKPVAPEDVPRISTGCAGLDTVLDGGLPAGQLFLVQGDPGAGKTTLGLQFLRDGVARGERCLYIPLSESQQEIQAIARSHGWSLDGLTIHELATIDRPVSEPDTTLFHPTELELTDTIAELVALVERVKPDRLVFDSLSELRLLATNTLRYRRHLLSLKKMFAARGCTVLLLDDRTGPTKDDATSIAHGVIDIVQQVPIYGPARRRIHVSKLRGVSFREGHHDLQILTGGLVVHPRLRVADIDHEYEGAGELASGLPNFDRMLGGGLPVGATALFLGPAGSGKSSLALQYVVAAAKRREHAAVFNFDESRNTLMIRAKTLGVDLRKLAKSGIVTLRHVEPTELPPGELVTALRQTVDENDTKVVVIDSLNGYLQSMPEESFMLTHLHDLLAYLRHRGVVCIVVVAQHGLVGTTMVAPIDVSYLADTVVVFRYFEHRGRIRKAVSVLKKRTGHHESSIRELALGPRGVVVGEPLEDFEGVMSGIPREAHGREEAAPVGRHPRRR